MSLAGKVVLITGGRRVGADLARRLADLGASVALTYHTSRETIERTVAEVESRGPAPWPSPPTCPAPTRLRAPSPGSSSTSGASTCW